MNRLLILTSIISLLTLSSCTSEDESAVPFATGGDSSTPSSFTGKYTTETSGYVTHYDGADGTSVAYYVPEIENGWYHCAVSQAKLGEIPSGSAIELTANGKTIHLLVTDLCTRADAINLKHINNPNYFFDLEKTAFSYLADLSVGELQMKFKIIPYPTAKNIGFISTSKEQWYLQGRFYNMRYPIKKFEYSLNNGTTFFEMEKVAKDQNQDNNLFCINGKEIKENMIFRLTDIHNQVITTNAINIPSTNGKVDLGKNFKS